MASCRKTKWLSFCAAVLPFAAVIALLAASCASTPMPVYQGKTAREWLYATFPFTQEEQQKAFHEMGSNAVPYLVHELEREDPQRSSDAKRALLYTRSRSAVTPMLLLLSKKDDAHEFYALVVLYNLAKPEDTNWVPQLTASLNSRQPWNRVICARVLEKVNSGQLAIPALTNMLSEPNWISAECLMLLERVDSTNAAMWHKRLTNGWGRSPQTNAPR
jgi:HEAT repeat protein